MSTDAQQRATKRIADLADRGLDLVSFWEGCAAVLAVQGRTSRRPAGTRSIPPRC